MSATEEVIDSVPTLATGEARRPTPWLALLLAGGLLAGTAALCLALLLQFINTRPLDLRRESRAVASVLDGVLLKQGIPASRITAAPEAPMQDTGGRWFERRYDVAVPKELGIAAVSRAIRTEMAARNTAVLEGAHEADGVTELRVTGYGRDMAVVRLLGTNQLADLMSATRSVAARVSSALSTYAPVPLTVQQGPAESKSNEEAVWESLKISVSLPPATSPGDVIDRLRNQVSDANVTVVPKPAGNVLLASRSSDTAVLYKGLECVDVTLYKALPQPLLAAPTADLPFQLSGLEVDDVLKMGLPSPDELPLDSSELNGEARMQALPLPEPQEWETPRVAIIVDDGGYGGPITEHLLQLDPNLTLSILPHTPYGTETAERAEDLGFQVMLHMPMENSSGHLTFPGQITTDMTPDQIHELTKEALEEIPGAVGINNHTGSKFTSNAGAMKVFLEGIEKTNLFFVDSRTIGTTKAYDVAKELNIPSAARDLFLDHESDPAYIHARFKQLIDICKHQGRAIGICHFRKNTVPILQEMLPEFKKAGIKLVHVSELIP